MELVKLKWYAAIVNVIKDALLLLHAKMSAMKKLCWFTVYIQLSLLCPVPTTHFSSNYIILRKY